LSGVVDVAGAQRERLADAQGRAQKHLDQVAHLPIGLGPLTCSPVRQFAAAARMAAICSKVSACGAPLGRLSGLVPSTGLRGMASWRRAKPNSRFSWVRECLARE